MKLSTFLIIASLTSTINLAYANPLSSSEFELILITNKLTKADSSPLADPQQGEILANQRCVACHGQAMLKMMPNYPSLYGQKAVYLFKQLTEFKSGKRTNPIMQGQAGLLTDSDIKNVSLYYSLKNKIKITN